MGVHLDDSLLIPNYPNFVPGRIITIRWKLSKKTSLSREFPSRYERSLAASVLNDVQGYPRTSESTSDVRHASRRLDKRMDNKRSTLTRRGTFRHLAQGCQTRGWWVRRRQIPRVSHQKPMDTAVITSLGWHQLLHLSFFLIYAFLLHVKFHVRVTKIEPQSDTATILRIATFIDHVRHGFITNDLC